MPGLHEELMISKERLREKQKLTADYKAIEESCHQEEIRHKELLSRLEKEGSDVSKLEGLSLKGLFYSVLGSKEAQLDKERQEYLAAKLQFDECVSSLNELKKELAELQQRILPLKGVEEEYQQLMVAKERAILAADDPMSRELSDLVEALADLHANKKEINEALTAGESVLSSLQQVLNSLNSAKGWGTWDLLGGGLIATAVKHSKIDDAKGAAELVQQALRRYIQELKDVDPNISADITVDIGSFATFADFFFDGLIADWVVQSRINKSLEQAYQVEQRVNNMQANLRKDLTKLRKYEADLVKMRQELLELD